MERKTQECKEFMSQFVPILSLSDYEEQESAGDSPKGERPTLSDKESV